MSDRRTFMKLAALGGGVVFVGGLAGCAQALSGKAPYAASDDEFFFVQLSDSHWGYSCPDNPDAANTLKKAVATVNELDVQPDFIMFPGDLTHTTDDPVERRRRLAEFREIVGASNYVFDHKGVHFIVVDNVSQPGSTIGPAQLEWLHDDLSRRAADAPIVVFTHRPLFDLVPKWDWATRDGDKAVALLMPFRKVTVFYGHIHQENHHMTGHIAHHSAKSLIFPLPAPGSQEKRAPLPWDPANPYKGLGFREVEAEVKAADYQITEFPVLKA